MYKHCTFVHTKTIAVIKIQQTIFDKNILNNTHRNPTDTRSKHLKDRRVKTSKKMNFSFLEFPFSITILYSATRQDRFNREKKREKESIERGCILLRADTLRYTFFSFSRSAEVRFSNHVPRASWHKDANKTAEGQSDGEEIYAFPDTKK